MDRRSLLLTGAGVAMAAGGLARRAVAQSYGQNDGGPTELPPARSNDESPPVQRDERAYQRPARQTYAPQTYDPAPSSSYARQPYARQPYAPQPYAPQPYARGSTGDGYGPAPGTRGYDDGAQPTGPTPPSYAPNYPVEGRAETYEQSEIVHAVSDFLGVTAEAAGSAIERVFAENGRPTAYIAGQEASGAFIGGLRYGKGLVYMKRRRTTQVFWQGPSVGWDFGGNASRVFTLAYNLQYPDAVFRRFPGVEGSAYFIGGVGVNYQRAEDITLAPVRAGVGLRLGANIGYLAYSRQRHWFPL